MPTRYSRVTLMGTSRHADVLLPSQTPVGTLLPQVLSLLDEEPSRTPKMRGLYRSSGQQLEPTATLESAGVLDGETLRVATPVTAPDAPVVYDLHDTVAAETEARGRWGERSRHLVQGSVAAALGWWATVQLTTGVPDDQSALMRLGIAAFLLLASFGLNAWLRHRAAALTVLAVGAAVALDGHWELMSARGIALPTALLIALCAGVPLLVLTGVVSGHRRVLLLGAAVIAGLTAAWAVGPSVADWLIGDRIATPSVAVGALTGVIALLVLAVLAQAAAIQAGLTSLDDQESAGARLLRADVTAAVAEAHRGMILGAGLCGLSLGVSFWLVSEDTVRPAFSVPFIVALTLGTWLRARAFPLTLQRGFLHIVTAWGLWCTVRLASTAWPTLAVPLMIVIAGVALALLALQIVVLPAHLEARARRVGHVAETLSVVALVPLLIGYVGLYSAMLETFS